MNTMNVAYLVGFLLIIAASAWAAYLLGVPPHWIGVIVIALLGIAAMKISKRQTNQSDPWHR